MTDAGDTAHDRIMAEAGRIEAQGEASESVAPYPVNQPTIGTWLDAMGYDNDRFRTGEAPPSMAQVWTMPGLGRRRPDDDPLSRMMEVLTDEGYPAVLGTNCEQTYDRYLRVGEQVRVTTALDAVVGPKRTAMGEGYFVTSRNTWYVDHPDGRSEQVATMLFRVLKFRPESAGFETGARAPSSTSERATSLVEEGRQARLETSGTEEAR